MVWRVTDWWVGLDLLFLLVVQLVELGFLCVQGVDLVVWVVGNDEIDRFVMMTAGYHRVDADLFKFGVLRSVLSICIH